MQHNVEIAMRPAVNSGLAESGESNASFILDARRDLGINRFLLNVAAFALALGARIADYGTCALAGGTRPRDAEKSLLIAHLSAASAAAASCRRLARRAARPLAGVATLVPAVGDLGLGAEHGLFKFEGDVLAKIGSALRTRLRRRPPAASKNVAETEELPENIVEVLKNGGIEPGPPPEPPRLRRHGRSGRTSRASRCRPVRHRPRSLP